MMLLPSNMKQLAALVAATAAFTLFDCADALKKTPIRSQSLYMPYVDQNLQNRWFDYGGDAIINTNKHIRLTMDRPSQSGHVWSKYMLMNPSWEIEFEYKFGEEQKYLSGDGMAFWATEGRMKQGPVFGNEDYWKGLGIAFDSYPNGKDARHFPYVMAMMGDGRTHYDATNDGKNNELAGCEADFMNKDFPTKARVTYVKDKGLDLHLQYKAWDEWTHCFSVNVSLPAHPYIGFTALTGDVFDSHDLISISTSSLTDELEDSDAPETHETFPHSSLPAESSSSMGALGWFLILVGLCAVGGVGFIVFRMYQTDNKRF